MVSYLGDYAEDAIVYLMFNTFSSDDPSASVTITNFINTDVHIHKNDGLTQRNNAAGITVSVDFDGITGSHMIKIDTSDDTVAGFWVAGADYFVRIEGTTIDGATINVVVGHFSIENRFKEVDLTHVMGTILSEGGAGRLAAAFIKLFDVATPLLVASDVMRGTDSANTTVPDAAGTAAGLHTTTDGKIDTMQGNVTSILEDTATTIPGTITTMQGNVTSILDDTGTTIPGTISTMQGNITDILADSSELQGLIADSKIAAQVKGIDDIDLSATMKLSINAEVDNALNTAIPGSPTADSVNERVKAIDDKLPSKAYLAGSADADGGIDSTEAAVIQGEAEDAIIAKLVVRTNTAQAGGANSITLDAGASPTNDWYVNQSIYILSGTGAGQSRKISSYVGATKVATVDSNWATNPDATSVFVIFPFYILTGTGASASEVWSYATRILTANTNLNDLSAAEVNAEVDTALADYDPPTRAELTTDKNSIISEIDANETKIDAAAAICTEARLAELDAANLPTDVANVKTDTAAILVDTGTTIPGTITTMQGNVTSILEDTGTTIPGTISTMQGNVTDILTDTGTTIPGTIATMQGNVTDIVADTNELQGLISSSKIAAQVKGIDDIDLSATMKLSINAEVDTALSDYDAPTKAELDSGLAGLNDLSAAEVNAEVDTGLADYDAPTKAELDAGLAGLNDLSAVQVNAEVDTALSDYDGPTKAEMDSAHALLATPAQVNAQVLDVLNVDTFTEPAQGAPPATPTIRQMAHFLYKQFRNKEEQDDSGNYKLYADDGSTVDQKATKSDDDTTFAKSEMVSGP